MAISFNTGTAGNSGSGTAASQALTIPAGVLAGDVVIIAAAAFAGAAGGTLSAASTGTTPTLIDQAQTALFAGFMNNGGDWYFIAAAGDAGKIITLTLSGGTNPFWSASLAAWTGASNTSPIDVHGIATAAAANITPSTPSLTTGVAGDWAIQMAAIATPNGTLTEPAGTTSREKNISAAFVASDICDSNASVGGSGTGIGGGTYTGIGAGNVWAVTFTVGLAPPASAAAAAVPSGGALGDEARVGFLSKRRWLGL